ncbi:MAG: biotin--[acetyl-CoA-carboxylase] ligase [Pseudomonadota bacterium]
MLSDLWPDGHDRLILQRTASTMDIARDHARGGHAGPIWIMTPEQTAGRGRRGRAWTAPRGNLNATLLIRPDQPPAQAALLGFAAALAVADLVGAAAPQALTRLKWPNDVLVEGGKISGILLESEGQGDRLAWLAVGIGVNLIAAPPPDPAAAHPPACLADHADPPPTAERALTTLAARFARWRARFDAEGFAPLRDAWLARAARLGETVEARLPGETIRGTFADLDADGALVLHTPTGARRIAAADVHFP